MSLEERAPLLVYSTEKDIGDYDWDESSIPYYVLFWYSLSGNCFQDYVDTGQQEAIDDCIEWLDSEYYEANHSCEIRRKIDKRTEIRLYDPVFRIS